MKIMALHLGSHFFTVKARPAHVAERRDSGDMKQDKVKPCDLEKNRVYFFHIAENADKISSIKKH